MAERKRHYNFIDMTNTTVGPISISKEAPAIGNGARWHFRCKCGNSGIMMGIALREKQRRWKEGRSIGCEKDCKAICRDERLPLPKRGVVNPKRQSNHVIPYSDRTPSKEDERIEDVCRKCGAATLDVPWRSCFCKECHKRFDVQRLFLKTL